MAVTAHWLRLNKRGKLVMRTRLVAFRHVVGSHSGENLAGVFVTILRELGVTHKVDLYQSLILLLLIYEYQQIGHITLDNASNCNSMLDHVEWLLRHTGVSFEAIMQRLR